MASVFQRGVFQPTVFQIDPISVGGGLPPSVGLSRKRFREIIEAQRALEEAERRAAETSDSKRKTALEDAARVAQAAIDAVEQVEGRAEALADLRRMTEALEAAASARRVVDVLRMAKAAQDAANAILDDEEEAVMLLLH